MKHLKTKLLVSVAMVLLATVLMSTASFAWFTLSTNPEISNIHTSVGANENLEIALSDDAGTTPAASAAGDAGNNTKWGNLVDLNAFEFKELKPAKFENGVISVPTFGLDGRIVSVDALTATPKAATGTTGNFIDGAIFEYKDTAGNIFAYRIDFFLRSNMAGTVTLGTAHDRGAKDTSGAGSTITQNSNITIVFQDGSTFTPATDTSGVLTGNVCTLTANTAKKISMFIYVDGANLTNANMLLTDLDVDINIQFTMTGVDDPLDIKGTDYDKVTPTPAP